MSSVIIKNDVVFSFGADCKVKAWSIPNNEFKYEIMHGNAVCDIVIGRKGTPLANQLVSFSNKICRISNLETGTEIERIYLDGPVLSMAVDNSQTMIAIGTEKNLVFIETMFFYKVTKVAL